MSRLAEASNRFYDSIRREDSRRILEGQAGATGFAHLEGSKYCLVSTYKRSGEGVPTPVWFGVDDEGRLYFRTYGPSAKVKRIRWERRVRVAPCTVRGKPLGPAAEGAARILGGAEEEHAERTIQSNYGLFRRIYESAAPDEDVVYVEVTPA